MRILSFLENPISSFHFAPEDLQPLQDYFPEWDIIFCSSLEELEHRLPQADVVLTWVFPATMYKHAHKLKAIFTPAAGHDWVYRDPKQVIPVHYGSFHGAMIAESLLAMMLYFNTRIQKSLIDKAEQNWDRNAYSSRTLLANQTALIVGYGHIGKQCGALLRKLGMQVLGFRRNPPKPPLLNPDIPVYSMDALKDYLPNAHHIILLLPLEAKGLITSEQIRHARGAVLYNFGRGGTISDQDILDALNQGYLSGAGLDVTQKEPLPSKSLLWQHPQVFLTPHSSCCYEEYRSLFISEIIEIMRHLF
jgi:D-2-hydroxyacid dehydrogenase (NADP+)